MDLDTDALADSEAADNKDDATLAEKTTPRGESSSSSISCMCSPHPQSSEVVGGEESAGAREALVVGTSSAPAFPSSLSVVSQTAPRGHQYGDGRRNRAASRSRSDSALALTPGPMRALRAPRGGLPGATSGAEPDVASFSALRRLPPPPEPLHTYTYEFPSDAGDDELAGQKRTHAEAGISSAGRSGRRRPAPPKRTRSRSRRAAPTPIGTRRSHVDIFAFDE
jgi:hypothetical protein